MQRTKEKKNRTNRQKFSSINSIIDIKRNQIKHIPRGRRKKGASNANVNFLTSNSLKSINNIKLSSMIGEGLFNDSLSQVIKDIYPIIKDDISIFMQPNFSENTDEADFLHWMLSCYEELYADEQWSLIYGDKWILIRSIDYPIPEENTCPEFRFLYTKESHKDYQRINNLFIMFLSLSFRRGNAMWWDNHFHDMAIDQISERVEETISDPKYFDKEEINNIKDAMNESEFLASLQAEIKGNTVSLKEFKGLINEFKPLNTIERRCIETFKNVIDTMNMGINPNNYSFVFLSEEEYHTPLTPACYSYFGWALDDEGGWIGSDVSMYMTSCWNEGGTSPFRDVIFNEKEKEFSDNPFLYTSMMNELQTLTNYLNE